MSALDDAIDRIKAQQLERQRYLCELGTEDGEPDDSTGIDIVVELPDRTAALIVNVSWGGYDIVADLTLYVNGTVAAYNGCELDGTTSIWATRP